MAQVRYIGSNNRIAGLIGSLVETRTLSIASDETALVSFASLPRPIRAWNLKLTDLELVA
jgi:hypothetical protein